MSDGGKGDTQRPTNWEKFNANFDAIFGRKDESHSKDNADAARKEESSDSRAGSQTTGTK